jgi:hypothetical protein
MKRRTLLQIFAAAAAWARIPHIAVFAQQQILSATDETRLRALADVVLPSEIGSAARSDVVAQFLQWLRNYRANAEMDHGYGFPRLRRTSASPAGKYPAQLAALDTAARRHGGSFESLPLDARSAIVAGALDAAKVVRLPFRPNGEHIASDLMAFYFNSAAANDLAYRAAIGSDACRGLPESDKRPSGGR